MGFKGRVLGLALNELVFFLITLVHINRGQKVNVNWNDVKQALKIVLPLLPASLLYLPLLSYDNIVLEKMNNASEMGLYNIGKGIATFLYTALYPFYQAFEPDIYKKTSVRDFRGLRKLILMHLVVILTSLILFWIISPYTIDYLTAGKYNAAKLYANILVVTSGLMIMFSIFDAVINALYETKKSLVINLISAIICVILYTLCGLYFKQIGVAFANVVTYLCLVILQFLIIIRKVIPAKRN
jgi:O-antigen/teichoic acid export membrane protein